MNLLIEGWGFQFALKVKKMCHILNLTADIENPFHGFEDIHLKIFLVKFDKIQRYRGEWIQVLTLLIPCH